MDQRLIKPGQQGVERPALHDQNSVYIVLHFGQFYAPVTFRRANNTYVNQSLFCP